MRSIGIKYSTLNYGQHIILLLSFILNSCMLIYLRHNVYIPIYYAKHVSI